LDSNDYTEIPNHIDFLDIKQIIGNHKMVPKEVVLKRNTDFVNYLSNIIQNVFISLLDTNVRV